MYVFLVLALLSWPQTRAQKSNWNPNQYGQAKKGIPAFQVISFHRSGDNLPMKPAVGKDYDPRDDFLYRAYLAATIIGVFGGVIGLVFLYNQLVATKLAAVAAKESADAANKNADVLMASQKAQIALKPHGNPAKDIFDPRGQRLQIELENIGNVLAFDLTYETWIEILPFPFEDFTTAADYVNMTEKKSLYAHHSAMIVNIPIKKHVDHPLTPRMQEMIKNNDLYVCVRVAVKYRDAFSDSRYANFGIYVMANGMGYLPKYNDSN